MPGRHVHFAEDNTYHSPASPLTTLPVSSAPIIPPKLPGPTPYDISHPPVYGLKRIKPILKENGMRLHALLTHAYDPAVNYDLKCPPSTISTHHPSLSTHTLSDPATSPPRSKITIVSPHLPWLFVIQSGHTDFVSVSDVLSALYHNLRINVTSKEFISLLTPRDQQYVTAAYDDRCKELRDLRMREDEKQQGIKRVDFLMGQTRFMGLTSSGSGVWILHSS